MNIQFILVMVLWQLALTTKDIVPEAHLGSFYQGQDQPLNSQDKLTPLMGANNASLSAKPLSMAEYRQLEKSAQEHDFYCRANYGMNSCSFENLMCKKPDGFVDAILSNPYLSDVAKKELWGIYKYRQGYDGRHENKVASQTNKINATIKKSENERNDLLRQQQAAHDQTQQENQARQLKQQALFKLSQKYPVSILQNSNYVSPHQTQRKEALTQTVKTDYVKHEQTHEIDAQTAGMLEAQCINHRQFQSLSGTIFQHQLFHEIADCYKKIAKITFEHGLKNSLLTPHVLQFAQTSFAANQLELVGLSVQLNDIADFLAESSLSACKGAIESVCNLGDMAWNYQETAASLGKLLHGTLCVLGGALQRYNLDPALLVQDRLFEQDKQNFHQMCDVAKILYAHAANNSTQENIQTISRLATDIIVTPVIICHVGKACYGLISHARELRVLENITAISEDLGFAVEMIEEAIQSAPAVEQLITITGDLSRKLKESLIYLTEAESGIAIKTLTYAIPQKTISLEKTLQLLAQNGAPVDNILFRKEVLLHFNELFRGQDCFKLSTQMKEFYNDLKIIHNEKLVRLICNPEHILTYDLQFRLNKTTGLIEGRIYGGHYEALSKNIEMKSIIQITEECSLPCGGRGVKYSHDFGKTIEIKTEFSSSLCHEKVMQNIIEVVSNKSSLYFDTWFNGNKQKIHKVGKALDGSVIEVYLLEIDKGTLFLESAFPYFEKYSKIKGL